MRQCLLFIAGLFISLSAAAHHGMALFDTSQPLTLTGRVIDFRLMDPHSLLYVEVLQDSGAAIIWQIEGGSGSGIVGAGLSREFLASEPIVTIQYYPARDAQCAPSCRGVGQDFDFQRD